MQLRTLGALALLLTGCPKNGNTTTTPDAGASSEAGTQFVVIPDDDYEDPEIIELQQFTAECGNLKKLEPSAMMGRLDDAQIRCLDKALRESEKQTHKDKLSRVLMADAWAKGNTNRWETIVRRHLNDIDRSDPDLCYKFSRYLFKKGPPHADETMRWADMALENRTQWKGDQHVARVYNLYKIKAVASTNKWRWQEEKFVKAPTEDLRKEKTETRNQAKTLAREWLEYARSSGKDDTVAEELCESAAGTKDFCENVE